MLTTAEALQAVLANSGELATVSVPLDAASGRVLRQSVAAERDQPPFDRVMMDGIALRAADLTDGRRRLLLQGLQAAGDPVTTLGADRAIEIMTGASLPLGADAIVPVERLTIANDTATLEEGYEVRAGRFIHRRGSDYRAGDELLRPTTRISPLDVAVIASCGLTSVEVAALPRIRVVATGNELVPAGQAIAEHQVRLSNGPALAALLAANGYPDAIEDQVVDDEDTLRATLAEHLAAADVLLLSGGVSMGKADYVPGILAELGVECVFHKVRQRPGKPLWFGVGRDGQRVFGLPGNPVSALVCCRQYVIPSLRRASGQRAAPPEFAALASNVSFAPDLTCFQPVRLTSTTAAQAIAIPVKTNTSGDFAALSGSDGYIELPREETQFPAGTAAFLHRWIAD